MPIVIDEQEPEVAEVEQVETAEQAAQAEAGDATLAAGEELLEGWGEKIPDDDPSDESDDAIDASFEVVPEPAYTKEHDLLDLIANAEHECAQAESIVNELKEDLKAAKKRYDARVDRLRALARQSQNDAERPLFNKSGQAGNTQEATDVAADAPSLSAAFVKPSAVDESSQPSTSTADPNAWRAVSIDVLGLKSSLTEKLAEAGLTTLGELEDFRAKAAEHAADWPKGVGKQKITQVEDAVVAWLTKNRDYGQQDSKSVPVTTAGDAASDATRDSAATISKYNLPDAWEQMTHDQQCEWMNARAVELDSDDVDVLDLRGTDNETVWEEGCDAFDGDDTASNCPYGPGEDCDAWLIGWLWQGKQEEGEEGE